MAKEPSTLEADRAFLGRHPRAVMAFVISLPYSMATLAKQFLL
jgi:hypothetical protein